MRLLSSALLLLALSVLSEGACAEDVLPAASGIASRYEALVGVSDRTAHLSTSSRERVVGDAYAHLFAAEIDDPGKLDDRGLAVLFEATHVAAFYTIDNRQIARMASILAELHARSADTERQHADLYGIYVKARMFDRAGALQAAHPQAGLEPIPALADAEGYSDALPTLFEIDDAAYRLTRTNVRLDTATLVVVVAHPLCHFSRNAAAAINADVRMREAFLHHSVWIAPPSERLDVASMRAWNRANPAERIGLAGNRGDWSGIDDWATPRFYFFRNGALVDRVEGWPEAGHLDPLRRALRKIGLSR